MPKQYLLWILFFQCLFLQAQSPEVVVQLGHTFGITCIDKHPTKSWIATGAGDNQIKIWDYNLRKLILTIKAHNDGVKFLKFMPGSDQYLLSVSDEDQTIVLWDLATAKKIQTYTHENSFWPEGLGFTGTDANGKPGAYFYAGHQFGIEKWETNTGKLIFRWNADSLINDGKHHWIHCYEYSDELKSSFFAEGNDVYQLQHETGKFEKIFSSASNITSLKFNNTQKIIALGCADDFYIVDIKNRNALFTLHKVGNYYKHTVSLSDDGNLLFLNQEPQFSNIIRWKENKDLIWFKGSKNEVAVFVDHETYAIIAGSKGYPAMFNIQTFESRPFYAIDNGIKSLALFQNDRYLLKAGNESSVRIFDLQTADYVGALEGHTGMVNYATASKSGKLLATASSDQTIKIWDANTYQCIATFKSPYPINDLFSGDISSVAFKKVVITDDDQYIISFLQGNGALGKKNGYVWKWNLATGTVVAEYQIKDKPLAKNTYFSVNEVNLNPVKDEMIVTSYERLAILRTSDFKVINKNLDPTNRSFSEAIYSNDGKLICVNYNQGILDFFNAETGVKIKDHLRMPPTYIFSMAFNKEGTLLAAGGGFDDNRVFLIDTKTFEIVKSMEGHVSWVKSVKWSTDGKKLYSGGEDSKLILWNIDSNRPEVTLVNNAGTEDYVFYNHEGNYKITRSGFKNVTFRVGLSLFPFEQFDIRFNRPDLILQSLKSEQSELIDLYKRAYEKRLKSLGLQENKMHGSFYLPQISSSTLPYTVSNKEVKISINASDSIYKLKSLNIKINEIPLMGKDGIALSSLNTQSYNQEYTIPLTSGKNHIEVSCINEEGTESMRQVYDVTTTFAFPKPDLYIIVVSVSNYKDANWNLKYATKDGRDIARLFSKGFPVNYQDNKNENYFNKLYGNILLDTIAVRDRFMAMKDVLKNSKPNDQIIVFFSGHGLLDSKYDFYYATFDCDFNHPETKGISFSDIEAVLDAAPARNKLLFVDACHSGEVDKESLEVSNDTIRSSNTSAGITTYHTKGSELLDANNHRLSFSSSFNLMKEVFAGSERGTGTVIISAAAGDSYALESDLWNNGIFTYAIIEGIKNGSADVDHNQEISVTELKNFLIKEVTKKTQGRQKPTCRKENLEYDFRVK